MGYTEFLVAGSPSPSINIQDVIVRLEDLSTVFIKRWSDGSWAHAGEVSVEALRCFDLIVNSLMRARDDKKTMNAYAGSSLEIELSLDIATMASPATLAHHQAVKSAGPGNGHIPSTCPPSSPISLEKTLNKLKHRDSGILNFRIENGLHILVICPVAIGGGPDSVVEFDVATFCQRCLAAAASV